MTSYREREQSPSTYVNGVEPDGSFEIHNVPAGDYRLSATLNVAGTLPSFARSPDPNLLGTLDQPLEIDVNEPEQSTIALGELQLQ